MMDFNIMILIYYKIFKILLENFEEIKNILLNLNDSFIKMIDIGEIY